MSCTRHVAHGTAGTLQRHNWPRVSLSEKGKCQARLSCTFCICGLTAMSTYTYQWTDDNPAPHAWTTQMLLSRGNALLAGTNWLVAQPIIIDWLLSLHGSSLADIIAMAGVPDLLLSLLRVYTAADNPAMYSLAATALHVISIIPEPDAAAGPWLFCWLADCALLPELSACLARPGASAKLSAAVNAPDLSATKAWLLHAWSWKTVGPSGFLEALPLLETEANNAHHILSRACAYLRARAQVCFARMHGGQVWYVSIDAVIA